MCRYIKRTNNTSLLQMAWCSTFEFCDTCTRSIGCDWCFESRKCVFVSTLRCADPYADDPADCALDPFRTTVDDIDDSFTDVGIDDLESTSSMMSNVAVVRSSSTPAASFFTASSDERSEFAWSSLDVGLLTAGLVILFVALVAGIVFAVRRQRRRQLATPTLTDGETRTPTSATMGPSMSNVDLPHSTPVRISSSQTGHYAAAPSLETGTAIYSAAPQLTISIANQSYVQQQPQ